MFSVTSSSKMLKSSGGTDCGVLEKKWELVIQNSFFVFFKSQKTYLKKFQNC